MKKKKESMANRLLLLALLSSAPSPAAWAQDPAGAESRANLYTTSDQAASAVASEWTTFQHDSQHTGRSPASGPLSPDTASWSFAPVSSGVVIGPSGLIYACQGVPNSGSSWVTALSPDGTVAFETPVFVGLCSMPTIAADGSILVASYENPTSRILAFNADGSVKWTSGTISAVGGVTLGNDGTIYAAAGFWQVPTNQGLYAFNPDGSSKWTYSYSSINNVTSPAVAPNGTIVVTGILGGGTSFVRAHSAIDGSLVWEVGYPTLPGFTGGISAPAIAANGTTYFYAGTSHRLWAVSSTGAILWSSADLGGEYSSTPSIALDDAIRLGVGAVSTTPARLYSFSTGGAVQWVTDFGTLSTSGQYSGPLQIALDQNGTGYVAITRNDGNANPSVPILFIVSSGGSILWSSSPLRSYPWTLSASGTLYGVWFPVGGGAIVRAFPLPPLMLSIADVGAPEGAGQLSFDVSLSAPAAQQVTVDYATSNGTALAGPDYTAVSGTLTFAPGTTTLSILVPLIDDTVGEANETFSVNLSNASEASIADSRGIGTIVNDDGVFSLRINNASVTEGNSGTTNATFTVTLTPAASSTVTVNYQTLGGTATPGTDFTPVSGTLTFTAGQTSKSIAVPAIGDTMTEANETFTVKLIGAIGAVIAGGGQGIGTILNDDTVAGPLEVRDPACSLSTQCDGTHSSFLVERATCGQTAFLTTDTARLRQASVTRDGIVTDGVTLLLLRMASSVPVTFSLRLHDETPPSGEEVGALMDRNGCNRSTTVTVSPELVSGSNYVFAAYQAPRWTIPASVDVHIVATPQGGAATLKPIELRRPPVVLVHGVWSGPDTWRHVAGVPESTWTGRLRDAGFDVAEECLADYSSTPAGSFDPLGATSAPIKALILATRCTKDKLRAEHNTAVTQVDVVGHSMGGLVARARVKYEARPYSTAWNLKKGEFHKIITIGTPHRGTKFGDVLASQQCNSIPLIGTLADFLASVGRPIGPAIFGFQTSSEPIAHIGVTDSVRGRSVVGIAPTVSGIEAFLNEALSMFGITQNVDTLLGGNGNHDVIVPVSSQRGGLGGSLTSTITGVTHVSELKSPEVVAEVIDLVGLPATASNFGAFPAFQPTGTYRQPYVCPPSVSATNTEALLVGTLSLTPTAGEIYRPGEPVPVTATLATGVPVDGLLVSFGGELETIAGTGPWSHTFSSSLTRGGRVEIVANTYGGTELYAGSTYIMVLPAGSPIQLTAGPAPLSFAVLGEKAQIRVSGLYDDGGVFDLTAGAAGTTYLSNDTAVATVTTDGQVEARGNGSATIAVSNGSSSAGVAITVNITNAAPVLSPFTPVTMMPSASVDVPVSATDPNGNGLRIAGVDLPAFVTVVDQGGGAGVVQLRPTQADIGSHSLLISVTDDGTPPLGDLKELRVQVDFLDVPPTHAFYSFVNTLARNGVTTGCGGGNYCPDAAVTRAQMAVFLLVSKEGAGYAPPACVTPRFADVPCTSPYSPWINELALRGVTGGCTGGNYCPDAAVTRDQMAVFLLVTKEGTGYTPPTCTTPIFTDVPCSNPFSRWIYELVARAITGGCGGGNYCPIAPVTRGQMAVFLVTTFGL